MTWDDAARAALARPTGRKAIPLVGDLFDFAFRSNTRNLKILKRWLDKHHPATRILDVPPSR